MKRLFKSSFKLFLIVFLSGCMANKDVILDSDYSYNGKFNRYKSYNFMTDESTEAFDYNPVVQKVIKNRLGSMGYQLTETKPDLLITYKFFYDEVDFLMYDQPDFNHWIRTNYGGQIVAPASTDSIAITENVKLVENEKGDTIYEIKGYDAIKTPMLEGMIFLSFYDTRRNQHVWSGYMSGVFRDTNKDNEVFLRSSIGKILDEYKVLARGYKNARD